MDPSKQLRMPGPQFGQSPIMNSVAQWLKKHSQKIVIALIIILVATGTYYFAQSYQQRREAIKTALQTPAPQVKSEIDSSVKFQVPEVKKEADALVATAKKGNGSTHLAREAVKEYLKANPELKLSIEQKIYVEDYLRKHSSKPNQGLQIGDQLTFSESDINAAIDKALNLNASQLKNLSKYVSSVPSLNY